MSVLHSPERRDGESQAKYRARRIDSRRQAAALERPLRQPPALGPHDTSRFWLEQHRNPGRRSETGARDLGQRPKLTEPRRRKPKPSIPPTWPHTLDQHRQSRPLIVVRPLRHVGQCDAETRRSFERAPKHLIDRFVLHGGFLP